MNENSTAAILNHHAKGGANKTHANKAVDLLAWYKKKFPNRKNILKKIKASDIEEYLTSRYAQDETSDDLSFDYYAYYYKEAPKTPGGKSYVKVMPLLTKATNEGEAQIMSSVDWRKKNGYLKEYVEGATPVETADIGLSALDNL